MRSIKIYLVLILGFVASLSCETTKDDTTFTDLGRVFVSSNTQTRIGVFDFSDSENISLIQYEITTNDADGIYYDGQRDLLYQADRENNRINAYSRLSTNDAGSAVLPSAISTSDFSNPRGLTSNDNIAIVAQDASADNNMQNGLFVYDVSANSITLRNQYLVDFPLWDIQLVGNTLYAAYDERDSLAVFNNFLAKEDGSISADFKIRIEGLNWSHGLFYSLSDDLMIMTNIGNPDPSLQDGEIRVIQDFSFKLSAALQETDNTIPEDEQIIISGSNTRLRNPVDVIYHETAQRIIVAERATNGGMILAFTMPEPTAQQNRFNLRPVFSADYPGISGLYLDLNN